MFRVNITDKEIFITGDTNSITVLSILLKKSLIQVQDLLTNPLTETSQFKLQLQDLKATKGLISAPELILNFISDHNIPITARSKYLLQYWAFEIKQIEENKSYRSSLLATSQELISAPKLNTILDRCEDNDFLPTPEMLFNFFEHSKAMQDVMQDNGPPRQPPMPFEDEIGEFETKKFQDRSEIIKSAYLVSQGQRDIHCFFSRLPTILNQKIAGLTGDPQLHDEKSAMEISQANYGRPLA